MDRRWGRKAFWSVAIVLAALFSGASERSGSAAEKIAGIEKEFGYFTANRFRFYYRLLASLEGKSEKEILKEVNDFWNGVPYGSDMQIWGKRDHWATPYEFLLKDRGDCEDYVIAKYETLKRAGIDPHRLYFVYARIRGKESPHMVLAYYETPDAEPLVLDNVNLRIFHASKRSDLIPVYTFNGEVLARFQNHSRKGLSEHNRKVKRKWEDLMQRIERNPL